MTPEELNDALGKVGETQPDVYRVLRHLVERVETLERGSLSTADYERHRLVGRDWNDVSDAQRRDDLARMEAQLK